MALVTLSRNDQKFHQYLDGSFSEKERAIPIQSLNIGLQSETVTFDVKPLDEIKRPHLLHVWVKGIRPHLIGVSILPLLLMTLLFMKKTIMWNPMLAITASIAVIFIQIALNLLNDFFDHQKGVDRVSVHTGSRVIQQGWLTAKSVKVTGMSFLVLGVLFGLPSVMYRPWTLFLLGAVALIGILGFSSNRIGFKYRGLGEWVVFLLSGPLLSVGYSIAVSGRLLWEMIGVGILAGLFSVLLLNLKNFEQIITQTQAKYQTWMNMLGFDKSKVLLQVWLMGSFGYLIFFILYFLPEQTALHFIGFAFSTFLGVRILLSVRSTQSSLPSQIESMKKEGVVLYYFVFSSLIFSELLSFL